MNEMYNMGIASHYYSVLGILLVIFINIIILNSAENILKYKKQMSIFTPIGSVAIGSILFTGVIMMAAKHLEFTIENIIMITFAIAIILLEVKRAKGLKYLNPEITDALDNFKPYAKKLLFIEIALVMSISIWMWLL